MKTILLAEIAGCGREWLAGELRNEGYRVVQLDDGLALSEYLQFANVGIARMPWPDLIVSDVQLGEFRGVSPRRLFVLFVPNARPDGCRASPALETPVNLAELQLAIANFLQPETDAPVRIASLTV